MDPAERDLLIKTVAMEAGKGDPNEQAAVAHVILNRVGDPQYGKSIKDVLFQKNAFESWGAANTRGGSPNRPQLYQPGVATYDKAAQVVDGVLSGNIPDPTGGADRFQNPDIVNARIASGKVSKTVAAPSNTQRIGNQVFWSTSPLSQRKITSDAYADLVNPKQSSGRVASSDNSTIPGNKISPEGYADLLGGGESESGAEAAATQRPTSVAESVAQSRQQGLGTFPTAIHAIQNLAERNPTATNTILGTGALTAGIPLAGAGFYYGGLPIAAAARAHPLAAFTIANAAERIFGEPITNAARSLWTAIEGHIP